MTTLDIFSEVSTFVKTRLRSYIANPNLVTFRDDDSDLILLDVEQENMARLIIEGKTNSYLITLEVDDGNVGLHTDTVEVFKNEDPLDLLIEFNNLLEDSPLGKPTKGSNQTLEYIEKKIESTRASSELARLDERLAKYEDEIKRKRAHIKNFNLLKERK